MRTSFTGSVTILAALAVAAGCASSQPPRELIDARAAYSKAAVGDAAQLSPAALHEAKVALDNAEHSFNDDATSPMTLDRAYVATRKAELAEVLAASQKAKRDEQMSAAQKDQAALANKKALDATQTNLQATQSQLATAEQGRADAEKSARQALDKLAMANSLAVKDEPRGTVITVPAGVLFASGKSGLLPGATAKLEAVADALSHEPDHKITIEGHTDSQGSDASNMQLSEARAQTVRDFFASHGVAPGMITATGVGESRPIADNSTPEGRADNRRVEIVVSAAEKR